MDRASLSIEEVQKLSGLGKTKIYELLKSGDLPARKLGKRTLVLRADLDEFLSNLAAYPVCGSDKNV